MSINLDNFEVVEFARDTPFVLTSPTSLHACSQLNIEPIELVYKSLEHYEESLCHLPLSQIYKIYEEAETERQAKLLQCREQRKSLVYKRMTLTSPKYNNQNSTSGSGNNNNSSSMKKKSASASSVNKVNFQRNDLESTRSASTSRDKQNFRHSSTYFTSDTESNEGTLHFSADCDNCSIPIASRSVPDLRGNLDFRKVAGSAWSPRHYCMCHLELRDQDILADYFKRYDDILSASPMSEEDRKIMERLILKRAKMLEWERQSQELREILEVDRMKKYRASQVLAQQWQDKLAEKRRMENLENHRRFLKMQDKLQSQRKDLEKYLDERDKRIERYLEDVNFKKKRSMLEKQRLEALRQLEVSKAIEKLLEEDKQRRQSMRDRLQKRMTEAEIRKRRREQDYWRHISEMNRLDDIKRALKLEKIEQSARASVEELRHQLDEKEHRVKLNQMKRLQIRDRSLESGSGRHQQAIEKARQLHEELIRGFEEWNKKALELHIESQERAGMKHVEEINRRRARAASERVLREERTTEMMKRVHEMEERRKELVKSVIHSKDVKSARYKAEKERSINVSRIRAQHAAELRQQLKEKLNPETFDKKAARAEMELRVLRKSAGDLHNFSVRFNPKLLNRRCSSCRNHHRCNSFRNGSSNNNGGNGNVKTSWDKCCNNGKDKKKFTM
ncbi:unnamed protein product [Orchesella dallaii]|uniref:Coiled-coil domain-containing protein n=1 Tax=Orchesella dallaii TaxID=48710 RepID=A0ABP1QMB9_9HEXA